MVIFHTYVSLPEGKVPIFRTRPTQPSTFRGLRRTLSSKRLSCSEGKLRRSVINSWDAVWGCCAGPFFWKCLYIIYIYIYKCMYINIYTQYIYIYTEYIIYKYTIYIYIIYTYHICYFKYNMYIYIYTICVYIYTLYIYIQYICICIYIYTYHICIHICVVSYTICMYVYIYIYIKSQTWQWIVL